MMAFARRTVAGLATLLVLFHVWLFAGQIWSGELADPALGVRWVVAIGLVAMLAVLRRRGRPVVFGREAVAVWLLAALLHVPGIAERATGAAEPALPEAVVTLTQTIAGAGLALGLTILLWLTRRADRAPAFRVFSVLRPARAVAGPLRSGTLHLASRPPPARPSSRR
jgi:hypothetical protein